MSHDCKDTLHKSVLLTSCRPWGSNSVNQAWKQSPLPTLKHPYTPCHPTGHPFHFLQTLPKCSFKCHSAEVVEHTKLWPLPHQSFGSSQVLLCLIPSHFQVPGGFSGSLGAEISLSIASHIQLLIATFTKDAQHCHCILLSPFSCKAQVFFFSFPPINLET